MSFESAYEEPLGMPLVLGFLSNDILPQSIFAIQASSEIPTKSWYNPAGTHQYTLEKHVVGCGDIRYFLEVSALDSEDNTDAKTHYTYAANTPNVLLCDGSGCPLPENADVSPEILERQVIGHLSHFEIERQAQVLRSSTDRKFAGLIGQIILDTHTHDMIQQLLAMQPQQRIPMFEIIHDSVAVRVPNIDPKLLKCSLRTAILTAAKQRRATQA